MEDITRKTRPFLKICGVTRAEDLRLCFRYGVDFVGFNFFRGSPRYISPKQAALIWQDVEAEFAAKGKPTQAVGLFVNCGQSEVAAALEAFPAISVIQLHGDEDERFARELRRQYLKKIWQALPVGDLAGVMETAKKMASYVDIVLLDTAVKPEKGKPLHYGGSGKTFSWELLASWPREINYAIAGGVDSVNIKEAARYGPCLIDVCSGSEAAPGIKDEAKIAALCQALQVC